MTTSSNTHAYPEENRMPNNPLPTDPDESITGAPFTDRDDTRDTDEDDQ